MERKIFLKSLMVGAVSTSVLMEACKKDSTTTTSSSTSASTTTATTTTTGSCSVIETETEGPFPTHTPASYVRSDIRDDRTGYKMTVKIVVTDSSNNCNALANALVDIWHCDKDGNYSEYGGTSIQTTDYTTVHFLRGRQTTDANGAVNFTTIFPGWYSGRTTHIHVHIHVHIYNAAGTSLKVTQMCFPEGSGSALAAVNGYSKGLAGYLSYKNDSIFSDDTAGLELASVSGTTTDGFALTISMAV